MNIQRKATLWDDLKHVLNNGTWSDPGTIGQVLTSMSNMEQEANKSDADDLCACGHTQSEHTEGVQECCGNNLTCMCDEFAADRTQVPINYASLYGNYSSVG